MTPITPEEEEIDKQLKELQDKEGGVQVRPVGCLCTSLKMDLLQQSM